MTIRKSHYEFEVQCDHRLDGILKILKRCPTFATFYGDTLGHCKRKARKAGWSVVDKKLNFAPFIKEKNDKTRLPLLSLS